MVSISDLNYIITHVVLPPQLPQEDDSNFHHDTSLLQQCETSLSEFQNLRPAHEQELWASCRNMVSSMIRMRDHCGSLDEVEVKKGFQNLEVGDVLAFHIRAQNSGLVVRKQTNHVSFESFELSPTTSSVMGLKGRLRRRFPGPAIAMDSLRLEDPLFRDALVELLVQLDIDTPLEAIPKATKARRQIDEIRDTINPKFATEMLTGFLRGIGWIHDAVRFYKCTRDDVLWSHALKPWRRSPLWLLIRVALQGTLALDAESHTRYKSFMTFFMAQILRHSVELRLPNDTIFVISAKISRRVLKLKPGGSHDWLSNVEKAVQEAHHEIAARWKLLESEADPLGLQKTWNPSELKFQKDTHLTLLSLGPYLKNIATRPDPDQRMTDFQPKCESRFSQGVDFTRGDIFQGGSDFASRLSLFDLERWVETSLDRWLSDNQATERTCSLLASLLRNYIEASARVYKNDPVDVSLMLLTCMELWVALDKFTLRLHPLLALYNHGFPEGIFDPMLLPQKMQMARISRVEKYLLRRHSESTNQSSLVFEDCNKPNSLGVQFSQNSPYHRQLKLRIETAATIARNEKTREHERKTRQYASLMQTFKSLSCEEVTQWDGYELVEGHSSTCRKCRTKREANSIEITVHEWPLPENQLDANAAIFELAVPVEISGWRETTHVLQVDVFSPPGKPNQESTNTYALHEYDGLRGYFEGRTSRLHHASTSKPFVVSHYRFKKISVATIGDICVPNGLKYATYDSKMSCWASETRNQCDVRRICTFQFPPGHFEKLQDMLDETTHTSNEVLARQSDCPRSFTLHEFYAFASLRSGHRLQWRNIARELASRILRLNQEEPYLLVIQAAWQLGSVGYNEIYRESHVDLGEMEFGMSFMLALEEALGSIEGNWQGSVALRTLIILALRVLSISPYPEIYKSCYNFLRRARAIGMKWGRDVGRLCHEEENEEHLKSLGIRALEIALTCFCTFAVDQAHLTEVLGTMEDVSIATECCITIHDSCPAITNTLPQPVLNLLRRFERTSHFLEAHLRNHILIDSSGIDKTMQQVWSGYQPGSSWTSLPAPNERWLMTKTSDQGSHSMVTVHYNLLDGTLLVNGLPLTRLPRDYELHRTYVRFFKSKVLDVVPSTMKGMLFATRKDIFGQEVHFRMHNSELIIRTRFQGRIYELIPNHALQGDFSFAMIEDFAHCLDVNSGQIEWRPLRNMWISSLENWRMYLNNLGKHVLGRGDKSMIDIRSQTARGIVTIMSPLEQETHIHISFDCETERLEIQLPRMKLDFSLKDTTSPIMSKQFRGMSIDKNQSLGAFTGLVKKLVIHDVSSGSRSVIVPNCNLTFYKSGNHVKVMIDTGLSRHVRYHCYQIDNRLGRLVDNGSLQSRLFKIYLHATTSHCLIDRLTGRTGTEEALDILRGAAVRSFIELHPEEFELLKKIAQLTPRREFYPGHLKVMQNIEWTNLPPLSQHADFVQQVALILGYAKSNQVFNEKPSTLPDSDTRGDPMLQKRAAIRESSFQVHDFGAQTFTTNHDGVYASRDTVFDGIRELQVCHIATLVDEWSQELKVVPALLSQMELWAQPLRGPSPDCKTTFGFSTQWVAAPSDFFPRNWCILHDFLAQSTARRDKYRIMTLLSKLSYSFPAEQDLIQTLLAFATVPGLRASLSPPHLQFTLSDDYKPNQRKVIELVEQHCCPLHETPDAHLPILAHETQKMANGRRNQSYQREKRKHVTLFAESLILQWPTSRVKNPTATSHRTYIVIVKAMEAVRPLFNSWHRNLVFQGHIRDIQLVLDRLVPHTPSSTRYAIEETANKYIPPKTYVSFDDMTSNNTPRLTSPAQETFSDWVETDLTLPSDHRKLETLLQSLTTLDSTSHEKQYSEDLVQSFKAMKEGTRVKLKKSIDPRVILEEHLEISRNRVEETRRRLYIHLESGVCAIAKVARMIPRLSSTSILSTLSRDRVERLPSGWKESFVQYGLSIAALQRAGRLLAVSGQSLDLLSELRNLGHQAWDPFHRPDWLLLELENDIFIRQEQAQISLEMMAPASGSNSVMQLNMGQGKSSVIVPIIAATLADASQLVRVIVLKPLAMQMFRLLVSKLGGLLQRRIVYMPISRSLKLTAFQAREIRQLYEDCKKDRAILLLQPEHILSFELMGFKHLASGNTELGTVMIETQNWLYKNSRDILDESDEILSVRFELIYTMGIQRAIDFSPERWYIIQFVLQLLMSASIEIQERFPTGLEVISAPAGAVPRIRILEPRASQELLRNIVLKICECGIPGVPVWRLPGQTRETLFEFLTDPDFRLDNWHLVRSSFSESMKSGLLLLKGLFAGGLLRFAFEEKRWRVNFGLDLSRTMLAVPYHAKDTPSPRAEFSHPDTTIILTCLSYYYGSLTDCQLTVSFEALLNVDHAQEEYALWVKDAPTLPIQFQSLDGVNLSNPGQCSRDVFPILRCARSVINFYLSAVVFPAEMKEFPQKLSSSGWDIAREKTNPTTGFSGTNDSRYVLPLFIKQCDLPEQLPTNAAVLDCLLQPENSFLNSNQALTAGVLNAKTILDAVVTLKAPARVILDVGAQVLELRNEQFAEEWLSRTPTLDAQAVIFINSHDEICVLSRDGRQELLAVSPFAKQMDQCLVYLDESHTRGTDLKLPTDYRAMVTLGPGLTKDRLVQACMRMRKLGKGQSVIFCASLEVQRKILNCNGKDSRPIEVADVLKWCIATTCIHTKKVIPLWATQGIRHQRRRKIISGCIEPVVMANNLLEDEAQSLEQRYGQDPSENQVVPAANATNAVQDEVLEKIYAKCRQFKVFSFENATLQEEQERELSPESEREQQVELPSPANPYPHSVHNDLWQLVNQGTFKRSSAAFQPAFQSLSNTSAHKFYELAAWPQDLVVTTDFARTIRTTKSQLLDHFLRPVHWVITIDIGGSIQCVILSPFEANELLPSIRRHKKVVLHIYSPRTCSSIRSFENLDFCPVLAISRTPSSPPTSALQLNLFAGQLYFRTFSEYRAFCAFLGLCSSPPQNGMQVASDGFMDPNKSGSQSGFTVSPIPFVRSIMMMRRKGQGINVSHVGKILNGELIPREIFESRT